MKLFYPTKNKEKIWLWYVKVAICSSIQFIFAILFLTFVGLTIKTFQQYGWGINEAANKITIAAQEIRLWMVLFMSIFIFCSFYNIYALLRIKQERMMLFSVGIFTWLLAPYFIYMCINNSLFYSFFTYIKTQRFANDTIDTAALHAWLSGNGYCTKVVRNTIFFLICIVIFALSATFTFIPDNFPPRVVNDTFVYHSLSYFTKLTNIACFIYLLSYLYLHDKRMNDGNKLGIYMATYISVVGFVYWVALFPAVILDGSFAKSSFFDKFNDIWWHGLCPVVFTTFVIRCMALSHDRPERGYGNQWCVLMCYPLWYSMWAYISPFFARVSVYGFLTNSNPYMIRYNLTTGELIQDGKPYYILFILGFGLLFTFFFSVYRRVNNLIVRNRTLHVYNSNHHLY